MQNSTQDLSDPGISGQNEMIKRLPKADLHVHLEGSIRPQTLIELAQKNRVNLPFLNNEDLTEANVIKHNNFVDFPAFMNRIDDYNSVLREEEDFTRVTKELGVHAAQENVRYMEVTFSPGIYTGLYEQEYKMSFSTLMDAIAKGAEEARHACGIEMRFILDHDRNFMAYPKPTSIDEAINYYKTIAEWCQEGISKGVVALGLAGNENTERRITASLFKDIIKPSIAAGFPFVPHAGENLNDQYTQDAVRDALEILLLPASKKFPRRIGHGIGAINDENLIEDLIREKVVLEICLTSNIRARSVSDDIQQHPLRRLWNKGVLVTLNTDDPGICNTTITQEYQLAHKLGFTINDLAQTSLTAIQNSFLPAKLKRRMEEAFMAEFNQLQVVPTEQSSPTSTIWSHKTKAHSEPSENKEAITQPSLV